MCKKECKCKECKCGNNEETVNVTEAVVSIFLSTLEDITECKSKSDVFEAMLNVKSDGTEYKGQTYGQKLKLEDNEYAIVISDRYLTSIEARTFFEDIMEYHQDIENLSEEESKLRDEEVKSKWLNGNFNWWALGSGKLE
jgi:hypothetical protein